MREAKQVIILRTDLRNTQGHKVRTGKLVSQGAHASVAALLSVFGHCRPYNPNDPNDWHEWGLTATNSSSVTQWLTGKFTKITLSCDSEEALLSMSRTADHLGLPHALIKDEGLTEFGGVPTLTALAIGPAWSDEIDKITGHLSLL